MAAEVIITQEVGLGKHRQHIDENNSNWKSDQARKGQWSMNRSEKKIKGASTYDGDDLALLRQYVNW